MRLTLLEVGGVWPTGLVDMNMKGGRGKLGWVWPQLRKWCVGVVTGDGGFDLPIPLLPAKYKLDCCHATCIIVEECGEGAYM